MGDNFCKLSASRVPFSIKFRTDQDEDTKLPAKATVITDETVNDANGISPGYLGFSLNFLQEAC